MKLLAKLFGGLAVLALVFGLVACGEKSSAPAPVEEATEAVEDSSLDDMMSDAEEATDDAMEEAGEMMDDAGEEIEEMADDAGEAIDETMDDTEDAMNDMMDK